MIVVQLSGGLGNQMFQYALYRTLQSKGRDVALDDYTQYVPRTDGAVVRPIGLSCFADAGYRKVSPAEIRALTDADPSLLSKIRRKLSGRRSAEVRDTDLVYDPAFLAMRDGYLTGTYQSEKYFAEAEAEIRKAFTFREDLPELTERRRTLAREMAGASSCAVHLRFGDYLDKSETYGGICTEAYYRRAMELVRDRVGSDVLFYVFSDEPERAEAALGGWARQDAEAGREPAVYRMVRDPDEDPAEAAAPDWLDLYYMSRCRHHILANSSFSWWGSYLARRPGQIVVAPAIWLRDPEGREMRGTDIYRPEMLRIGPGGDLPAEDTPLVSVIVAAYNIKAYLRRAVESLTAQSYKALEIILVDDGSTDGTGALADELALKDPRIRVIHKANGGLSDARNAGLEIATGAYLAYLDGDDYLEPLAIESLVKAALTTGAPLAVMGYRQVTEGAEDRTDAPGTGTQADEEGTADPAGVSDPEHTARDAAEDPNAAAILAAGRLYPRDRAVQAYVEEDPAFHVMNSVWSKLFKRSLMAEVRFPVGHNCEDIAYTARALVRAPRCAYLPAPLYNYIVDRPGSIMNEKERARRSARRFIDEIPAWEEELAIFREALPEDLYIRALARYFRRLLAYAAEFAADGDETSQQRIHEYLTKRRGDVETALGRGGLSRGDRARLSMYMRDPALYLRLDRVYEKTVVTWRNT